MTRVENVLILSALWCLLSVSLGARAVIETYAFSSQDLEARYHLLSQELRCPKCQNQNIADSNAPIARDLRVVLFEQLEAGATDDEILAFMVARYGEFVRYRPGMDRQTLLLWAQSNRVWRSIPGRYRTNSPYRATIKARISSSVAPASNCSKSTTRRSRAIGALESAIF